MKLRSLQAIALTLLVAITPIMYGAASADPSLGQSQSRPTETRLATLSQTEHEASLKLAAGERSGLTMGQVLRPLLQPAVSPSSSQSSSSSLARSIEMSSRLDFTSASSKSSIQTSQLEEKVKTEQTHLTVTQQKFNEFIKQQRQKDGHLSLEFRELCREIKGQIEKRIVGSINKKKRAEIVDEISQNIQGSKLAKAVTHDDPIILRELVNQLFYEKIKRNLPVEKVADLVLPDVLNKHVVKPYLIGTQNAIAPEFFPAITFPIIEKNISFKQPSVATYCYSKSLMVVFSGGQAQSYNWEGQPLWQEPLTNVASIHPAPNDACIVQFKDNTAQLYTITGKPCWSEPLANVVRIHNNAQAHYFVAEFNDGMTQLCTIDGGKQLQYVACRPIQYIDWSPDGHYFIVVFMDKSVHLYTAAGQQQWQEPIKNVERVLWSNDSRHFVVYMYQDAFNSSVQLYTAEGQARWAEPLEGADYNIYWSPNSRYFIVRFGNGDAQLFDTMGQPQWQHVLESVDSIYWSPDSEYFIMQSRDNHAQLYTVAGKPQWRDPINKNIADFSPIAWSPNCQRLIVRFEDKSVQLYTIEGEPQLEEPLQGSYFSEVTWSSDSHYFIVRFKDHSWHLYTFAGQHVKTIAQDADTASFIKNHTIVITSQDNKEITLQKFSHDAFQELSQLTLEELAFIMRLNEKINDAVQSNETLHLDEKETTMLGRLKQHSSAIAESLQRSIKACEGDSSCSIM